MDNAAVYAIKFTGNDDFTSIATRCELRDTPGFKGICYLTPPDRGHMIEGAITKEMRHGFKFKSTGYMPGEWEFTALTIDNFRKRFGGLIMEDERLETINTTEELWAYFNQS